MQIVRSVEHRLSVFSDLILTFLGTGSFIFFVKSEMRRSIALSYLHIKAGASGRQPAQLSSSPNVKSSNPSVVLWIASAYLQLIPH